MAAKQQKNQMKLAFAAEGRGEAPRAAGGGTEAVRAGYDTESPASPTISLWAWRPSGCSSSCGRFSGRE